MSVEIVFIGGFPPSIARLSEYNYELLSRLVNKNNFRVHVLANRLDLYSASLKYTTSNMYVYRIWGNVLSLLLMPYIIYLRRRSKLLLISMYHGLFGRSGIINIITALLLYVTAKLLRYRIITILHTLPEARKRIFSIHKLSKLYYYGMRIYTHIIVLFSDKILTLVVKYAEILREIYPRYHDKIAFIHHGVPIYHLCRTRRVPGNTIDIGFIGLISPRKNLKLLLNTALKLNRIYGYHVRIHLIGAPHPYYIEESVKLLSIFIRDSNSIEIYYHGYMSTEKLQKHLCENIDVIVFPYDAPTGTSGIIHLVAPSAKPAILPGYWEFYELYKQGYGVVLVKTNSPDSFIHAIHSLINNIGVYEKYRVKMIRSAIKYSMNNIINYLKKHLGDVYQFDK